MSCRPMLSLRTTTNRSQRPKEEFGALQIRARQRIVIDAKTQVSLKFPDPPSRYRRPRRSQREDYNAAVPLSQLSGSSASLHRNGSPSNAAAVPVPVRQDTRASVRFVGLDT